MNAHVTESNTNGRATTEVAAHAVDKAADKRKPRAAAKSKLARTDKVSTKSKKDQLIALLSKPNGTRISVIVERLGWQAHTVRAALSGLRKQGIEIRTAKSPKTGETVYSIVVRQNGEDGQPNEATS